MPLLQDGKVRGPSLPRFVPGKLVDGKKVPWHPLTRAWWEGWRRSPQAMRMGTDADWSYLLETALLHHAMWAEGRLDLAAEIRLRSGKFGATPEDRARLGLEIASAATDPTTPDTPEPRDRETIDDRRRRLTGGVASLDDRRSENVLKTLDEMGS